MSPTITHFAARQLHEGRWVIDAFWTDGSIEQLVGVFVSQIDAERWVRYRTTEITRQRKHQSDHSID